MKCGVARPLTRYKCDTDPMDIFSEQRTPGPGDTPPAGTPGTQVGGAEHRPRERDDDKRPSRGPRPLSDRRTPEGRERARREFELRKEAAATRSAEHEARRHDPQWHRDIGQPAKPVDPTTHRLFISVRLPEAAIEEIGGFINAMPTMASSNVRWTRRENVHLTLVFLGDTSTELIPELKDQILEASANTSPFTLKLGETGAFPSYHSPKILWVGLDGEVRKLMQFQGRIEGGLRRIGFEPERRPFTPHITVGRTVRDLTRQYEGDIGFSWRRSIVPTVRAELPVNELHVLRSRLQTGGAVYEPVFTAPLGG